MKIFDLTKLIAYNHENYFTFNNSIIHYENTINVPTGSNNNIFLMVYRVIKYNISHENLHPWKIWNNGYNFFLKNKPELFNKNKHLLVNTKLFSLAKYRLKFDNDSFVLFDMGDTIHEDLFDFDGTGLAIIEYKNNEWIVKYNINDIFNGCQNQDTRIININGEYFLTYNMFLSSDNIYYVKMMSRQIHIDFNNNYLYLYPEKELLNNIKQKNVEKNCVLDCDSNILYHINGNFIVNNNKNDIITTHIPLIDDIINFYGKNNIFFSLGSPSIKYKNNYISVGHVKIVYNNLYPNTPFNTFFKKLHFNNIHKHGKFIYFMFLFEYDNNFNIIKISHSFIPTEKLSTTYHNKYNNKYYCHFPYFLVFPCGITFYKKTYIISYGEGDCKTKLLLFNESEIDFLLHDITTLSHSTYLFKLITPNYFKPKILHIGYFNEYNCGDSSFELVFKWFDETFFPQYKCTIKKNLECSDIYKYKLITLGGGDVVNDYFLSNLSIKNNIHAIGIGIPYEHLINKLNIFKTIILRNSLDFLKVKNVFPEKHILTYPDLVFLFKNIFFCKHNLDIDNYFKSNHNFKIGLCLTRTYFKTNYEKEYISFVFEIVQVIKYLISINYEVYLISFGINQSKLYENDTLLNTHIKTFFHNDDRVINTYTLPFYSIDNYVETTYFIVKHMDFMINSRFHAHIYSTLLFNSFYIIIL